MWNCPKCGRAFANTNQSHFCGKAPETIDEYILAQDDSIRDRLQDIRNVLRKTLPDADDFYLNQGEEPESLEDLVEEEELTGEMYDCHIYKCSQCGGEVIVSGTEASTRCMYCGSTAVVFNRIAQERRPDYIVPFKVTKEEAVEKVLHQLRSGLFVPKHFKVTEPSVVRGIYIPYYLYDGEIKDTQRFSIGHTEHIYDGECEFVDLPV